MSKTCCLPDLPRNLKMTLPGANLRVAVLERRQSVRFVIARILLVAYANKRRLKESDDGGEHLLARQVHGGRDLARPVGVSSAKRGRSQALDRI